MNFTEEIRRLIRCGHCLNFGASNPVTIHDKEAPNGEVSDNGKAVAFMCDSHVKNKPEFATQIYNNSVNSIRISELQDVNKEEENKLDEERLKFIEERKRLADEAAARERAENERQQQTSNSTQDKGIRPDAQKADDKSKEKDTPRK
jgi:hypothetical protein